MHPSFLSAFVLVCALAPLVYYVVAAYCAWRYFGPRRVTQSTFTPPVSILKPVSGLDRDTYSNFASFCCQDYPSYEVLFAVAKHDDPAVPVIQQLMKDFPHRSIRLLIGMTVGGPNNKVNKLCRLVHDASHDVFAISDSDIRVGPAYLRDVVGPLEDDDVGAVTALYRGISDGRLGSDLEAIGLSSDFVPSVLVARALEGLKFTLGATMATTRGRLASIGGFEPLAEYCADDFELGYRLAAAGRRVELMPGFVESECVGTTLKEFFEHQLRWAVSTRHSRPWGYFGLLFTQGLPWTVAAVAVAPSAWVAAGYAGAYAVLRLAVVLAAGVRGMNDPVLRRRWTLVPLRDAIAFAIFLLSLFCNRVVWREQQFYLRNGRLVSVGPMGQAGERLRRTGM